MKTNYLALAACGAYLATLADGGDDSATLHRAAVEFVNRLPLDERERICYASEDLQRGNAATVTEADAFLARVSREVRRILVLTGVVSADGGPAADEFYIAEVGEK